MNQVGGNHQPVNLTPAHNNTNTQNTRGTQGAFGRFKVSVSNVLKSFFTRLAPVQSRTITIQSRPIQSRTVSLSPVTPQSTTNDMKTGQVTNTLIANTLDEAKNSPMVEHCFRQVRECMEEVQKLKESVRQFRNGTKPTTHEDRRTLNLDMQVAKGKCKAALDNFNKTVGPDLQIDFNDLEMALGNKAQLEAGVAYPEFDQEFLAYSNYKALKNHWTS